MGSMFDEKSDRYVILSYILNTIEKADNNTQAMNDLLDKSAKRFNLDAIVIKEFTSDNSVRCTFEWCIDDNYELLNVEDRVDINIREKIKKIFDENDGYFISDNNSNDDTNNIFNILCRTDDIKSTIHFPIYVHGEFIGYFDYIDAKTDKRVWDEKLISEVKLFVDIITTFLFTLRELEEKSRMISSDYDAITQLPKYEKFISEVDRFRRTTDNHIGFISVDFSNFKYLNDKYGYKAGNEVLITMGKLISTCSSLIISCCRIYSDHYIVAFKQVTNKSISTIIKLAESVSNKAFEILQEKFYDVNLILNIGVDFMKPRDKSITVPIDNASIARKFAKQSKPSGNYRLMQYNISMSLAVSKQADYLATMQSSIDNDEFYIQLQPKCMTDTFRIVGAEALIRWRKNNYDVIQPFEFIPTFESNGCIVRLDYYVFEKIFQYIKSREDENKPIVPISVNVSHIHFETNELVNYISSLLEKYPISPEYLEFEFTEKIYVLDNPNVGNIINAIKNMGFRIYLDDFGAGYSSLNTLMKYSIDGIKLDRKFMKNRLEHKDKVIISGVVNLANKLNLEVVCVGVESEDQRSFLLKNECPYIQGFYFSTPVNIDQFNYLLDNC